MPAEEDIPTEELGAPNKPTGLVALVVVEDFETPKKPACVELDAFTPNKPVVTDVVTVDESTELPDIVVVVGNAPIEDPKSPPDEEDFCAVEVEDSFTKPNELGDELFVDVKAD